MPSYTLTLRGPRQLTALANLKAVVYDENGTTALNSAGGDSLSPSAVGFLTGTVTTTVGLPEWVVVYVCVAGSANDLGVFPGRVNGSVIEVSDCLVREARLASSLASQCATSIGLAMGAGFQTEVHSLKAARDNADQKLNAIGEPLQFDDPRLPSGSDVVAVAGGAMGLTSSVITSLFADSDVTALVNAIIARVETDLDVNDVSVAAIANKVASTLGATLTQIASKTDQLAFASGRVNANVANTSEVVVRDVLTSALERFVSQPTGLTSAITGSVAQLSQGADGSGGSTGTVYQLPLAIWSRSPDQMPRMEWAINEQRLREIVVTDRAGQPVALPNPCTVVISTADGRDEIQRETCVPTGTGGNVVNFANNVATTSRTRTLMWAIRRVATAGGIETVNEHHVGGEILVSYHPG